MYGISIRESFEFIKQADTIISINRIEHDCATCGGVSTTNNIVYSCICQDCNSNVFLCNKCICVSLKCQSCLRHYKINQLSL